MKTDRLSGFNPLRGLTLEGLVNYFEQGERGYYADLMWLYRMILRRSGPCRAVRRKLASSLGRLDWNIKLPPDLSPEREALGLRQQAALRAAYDGVGNLRRAIVHLGFADIMEFSHLNKVYAGAAAGPGADPWMITELRVVEQWFMRRQGLFAPWEYDAEAAATNRGALILPAHWISRSVDDPAAEIFAFSHVKMSTTDADWDQFCDTYAVPPIFVEGPANVRKDDEAEYQRVAESIVSDGRGYLPNGAKVHTVTPGTAGESVFTERLRYYREEIVLAGTGGILTTLDGNTGIGKGPAEEQENGWLDVAAAIGLDVSETLTEQFSAPILERLFPGEEQLAYFELDKPESSRGPGEVFADAKAAYESGYRIAREELEEKSGYALVDAEGMPGKDSDGDRLPLARVADEGARRPRPAQNLPAESAMASAAGEAKPSLVQAALAEDLELESKWLAPVAAVLAEIEAMLADVTIPLEDVVARIETARDEMPELLGALNVDALAEALEKAAGPAAIEGLRDGLRAKTLKRP